MKKHKGVVAIVAIIAAITIFFHPFLFSNRLPIPSDTIVGLYHPFRDLYAKNYPNGIPFKNFLITDPVRQQYPWRNIVIENFKNMQLPLWDPYSFSGTPLLANIQSATFYPGNLFFFFFPFSYAWSILILLQPLVAGIFLYMYLRNLRVSIEGSILGALAFAFSGFFIAWLEWGTVLHVALWLPLTLLAIDKLVSSMRYQVFSMQNKKLIIWSSIYVISLTSAFFAGHLQTFFYLYSLALVYFFCRWFQFQRNIRLLILFLILNSLFIIITFAQWFSTIQLILLSARDVDQNDWMKAGWFIPWQHAIQFIAPDFFGNPASLNYWSEWNYAEFVGYIGIVPLLMAILALFFRRDKKTLFFGTILFFSLFFAFPTFLANLPFIFSLPFISTAQPTRLLFLVDFSLAVLAAFGFEHFLKNPKKSIAPLLILVTFFGFLWLFVFLGVRFFSFVTIENIMIARRNLTLPTFLFLLASSFCVFTIFFQKKKNAVVIFSILLIVMTLFDLLRFGTKFTSFTSSAYLFPQTSVTQFLQKQQGQFRIMTTDSRILPPNFSSMYKIQSVDGYDPIYLRRYGELIAASERGKSDINPPFGFNRIITPHNYGSKIMDLLNVKYVLSLSDIASDKFIKVFQEGKTQIYENKNVLPRVFFVNETVLVNKKQDSINYMLNKNTNLLKTAVIEFEQDLLFGDLAWKQWVLNEGTAKRWSLGTAFISHYEANRVVIQTENSGRGFLVLSDIYYPTWVVVIDDNRSDIIRTDYTFRGIVVPPGRHTVIFYPTIFK